MSLSCCWWWLLAGVLLGWLLNWLFNRSRWRDEADAEARRLASSYRPAAAPSVPRVDALPTDVVRAVAAPSTDPQYLLAAAAVAAGITKPLRSKDGHDNFEIVEGIGPKINALLHAAGIHRFEQLANTPIERLSQILDQAGPNFCLANPETWARQAQLCARGEWEALKRYQDELVAGVSLKPDDQA